MRSTTEFVFQGPSSTSDLSIEFYEAWFAWSDNENSSQCPSFPLAIMAWLQDSVVRDRTDSPFLCSDNLDLDGLRDSDVAEWWLHL